MPIFLLDCSHIHADGLFIILASLLNSTQPMIFSWFPVSATPIAVTRDYRLPPESYFEPSFFPTISSCPSPLLPLVSQTQLLFDPTWTSIHWSTMFSFLPTLWMSSPCFPSWDQWPVIIIAPWLVLPRALPLFQFFLCSQLNRNLPKCTFLPLLCLQLCSWTPLGGKHYHINLSFFTFVTTNLKWPNNHHIPSLTTVLHSWVTVLQLFAFSQSSQSSSPILFLLLTLFPALLG